MKLHELRRCAYPESKAKTEKRNNPASFYVYRPLSWPLTWLAVKLHLSPIFITGVGALIVLVSLVLLCNGLFIMGAVLLNIAYMLDHVDGSVARATGRTSQLGAWCDTMVGFACFSFYPAALGLGLYSKHAGGIANDPQWSTAFWSAEAFLTFGLIGSAAVIVRKMGTLSTTQFVQHSTQSSTPHSEFAERGGVFRIPKFINSFSLLLLLGSAITGFLEIYILLFGTYFFLLMMAVLATIFRRLKVRENRT